MQKCRVYCTHACWWWAVTFSRMAAKGGRSVCVSAQPMRSTLASGGSSGQLESE